MPGVSPATAIGDIEALLIKAFGLKSNIKQSAFRGKQEWRQMAKDQADTFMIAWKRRGNALDTAREGVGLLK